MEIRPIVKTSLTDLIIEQVKRLILDGELKPGDRLPSERELAEKFSVGRSTLREALKAIEIMGIVNRTNEGTIVNDSIASTFTDPLTKKLILKGLDYRDLIETRKILEVELVVLSAQRATEEDVKKIEKILYEMNIAKGSNKNNFVEADMAYHQAVAEAAHNFVLLELFNTVRNLLLEIQNKVVEKDGIEERTLYYHKEIYYAIKNHNVDLGRKYMKKHIEDVEEVLMGLVKSN